MSRITKRPNREPLEVRSDAELVEDTMEEAPVENAADHTIVQAMIEGPPEDRAQRKPRKRQSREQR